MDMSSANLADAYLSGAAMCDTGECMPFHAMIFSEFACAVAMRPDYRAAMCDHLLGQFDGRLFIDYAGRLGWAGLADVAKYCELTVRGKLFVSALERSLDGYWTGVAPEWDDPDRLTVQTATAGIWGEAK